MIDKSEAGMIDFITDQCRDIYEHGLPMLKKAKEWHLGAKLIARQSKGHYTSNHGACHNLSSDDTPCKGYGNWILYVAGILAPGFHDKIANPTKGGSYIEGVLTEWKASPKDPTTRESRTVRLQKRPEKAQLFQDICKLLVPLTDLYSDCPRLAAQMRRVSDWESLETLCAAVCNRIHNCLRILPPLKALQR